MINFVCLLIWAFLVFPKHFLARQNVNCHSYISVRQRILSRSSYQSILKVYFAVLRLETRLMNLYELFFFTGLLIEGDPVVKTYASGVWGPMTGIVVAWQWLFWLMIVVITVFGHVFVRYSKSSPIISSISSIDNHRVLRTSLIIHGVERLSCQSLGNLHNFVTWLHCACDISGINSV